MNLFYIILSLLMIVSVNSIPIKPNNETYEHLDTV